MNKKFDSENIVTNELRRQPETFERRLIICLVNSSRFYRAHRERICPYDSETATWRQDFQTNRFNLLYPLIDQYWRQYDDYPDDSDFVIVKERLTECVIDAINRGTIPSEDGDLLRQEIDLDFCPATYPPADFFEVVGGAQLNRWLSIQSGRQLVGTINREYHLDGIEVERVQELASAAQGQVDTSSAANLIQTRLLREFDHLPNAVESELIGPNRFFCREQLGLIVGPTSIGKSTWILQAAIKFGLGAEMFGLKPRGPLRVLIIQSENDAHEIKWMRDALVKGLDLSAEQIETVGNQVIVSTVISLAGEKFISGALVPLVRRFKPDIVIIDPVFAFFDGDAKEQKDVGKFLRHNLIPVAKRFNCGIILVHHTNKPPSSQKDRSGWKHQEFAYAGSGSAEWANLSRFVIALRGTSDAHVFEMRVPKRGKRLGWKSQTGETIDYQRICHSRADNTMCWSLSTQQELSSDDNSDDAADEGLLLSFVPKEIGIEKKELMDKATRELDIPRKRATAAVDDAIKAGKLTVIEKKRSGARPQVWVCRNEPGIEVVE